MENIVTNVVRIIGKEEDIKHAIMMLCKINPDEIITKAISKSIGYELTDDTWKLIEWDSNSLPFDFKLLSNNSVSFKTSHESPYDSMLMLSAYNPNVYITIYYADEDFGYGTGIYKFIEGEEVDYYSPSNGSAEAANLSLSIIDDNYYLFEYICDLEEEELQDGISGSDEVIGALISHIFKNKILCDIYPIQLQEHLLNMAVQEEDYEYAADLKKVLDSAY